MLGAGLQTARRLIDAGAIGTPLTALTLLQGPGPQSWHPDPEFLFAPGAGPLFDLAPYYLSVLAMLFGPARGSPPSGAGRASRASSAPGPRAGAEFDVEVPTYVARARRVRRRPGRRLLFSWDSPLHAVGLRGDHAAPRRPSPFPTRTASTATCASAAPARTTGPWSPPRARRPGAASGVADMVRAIRAGTAHRASGELALHVLEMMTAIERSADSGAFEPVETRFDMALPPLDPQWDPYVTAN